MDINQLRVLNDYLNQTIDALSRQQWGAFATPVAGLSHSPYTPFGQVSPFVGASPYTGAGLGYTPFGAMNAFTPSSVVDPFLVQRGLTHSPYQFSGMNPWTIGSEIARQSQLTQAIAARQQVLEAIWRSAGIPV